MILTKDKANGATRAKQKEKTRRAIMESALALSGDYGYSSLSLREIARGARISPNAFYSHFHDLEDLRLAIIDEGGLTLRRLMREVHSRKHKKRSIIRVAVETFLEYVEANPNLFRLLLAARSSGHIEVRKAVYKEIDRFFCDLVEDIKEDSRQTGRRLDKVTYVAHAVTTIVFNGSMELIDLPDIERNQLAERLIQEIRLLSLGAEAMASGWIPDCKRKTAEVGAL